MTMVFAWHVRWYPEVLKWHVDWYPEVPYPLPAGTPPRLVPGWTVHADAPKKQMRHWDLTAWPRATDAFLHHTGTRVYRVRLDGVVCRDRRGMLCASDFTVERVIDARLLIHRFICDLAAHVLESGTSGADAEQCAAWREVIARKRELLDGRPGEVPFGVASARSLAALPWERKYPAYPYEKIFRAVWWPLVDHGLDYMRSAIEATQQVAERRWTDHARGEPLEANPALQLWAAERLAARLLAAPPSPGDCAPGTVA